MAPSMYPVSINPADVKLHTNHAAILHIDENTPTTCYTLGFAVLEHGLAFPSSVRGIKLHSGSASFIECPFKVTTTEGEDLIVGAIKHRGDISYFYYVLASDVKDWKPLSETAVFKEEAFWRLMPVTNANVLELLELQDTETAKLRANFGELVKLTSVFKGVKGLAKNGCDALRAHALQSYTINMKFTLTQAEKRLRVAGKAIATDADDDAESVGAAADAKARFASIKAALLSHAPFYDLAQEERLIEMDGDDGVAGAKAFVANLPQAAALLDDIADYIKWTESAEAAAVVAVTPFKLLLDKYDAPAGDASLEARPKRVGKDAALTLFPGEEAAPSEALAPALAACQSRPLAALAALDAPVVSLALRWWL